MVNFLAPSGSVADYPIPVFRIRDILVRIRIRGSVPLTSGSFSDPALFVSDLQEPKKIFVQIFLLLFFKGTFTSFFKDKKQKKRFFLLILRDDERIQVRIREAQKFSDL